MAKAFHIEGNYVKVAYPLDLFEGGNIPNLLSGIAGNIFGMKAVKHLRLVDATLPSEYIKGFKGPLKGMDGIRKEMKIKNRPLLGAVPKPKIGYSAKEHAEVGYETWMGGFDFVKDDENLASLSFNKFDDRVKLIAKLRDKAEKETGEIKGAFINVTAETDEMKRRADLLYDYGFNYMMIDVVTTGFSAVQTLRNYSEDLGLNIHAHRAMHAAFDRNPHHGISMQFLAKMMRLAGVSQIHSGTGVGKLVGAKTELLAIADTLRESKVKEQKHMLLDQDWGKIKSAFPVSSGGLHPGLVPQVMDTYGNDSIILVSGGIHGHPRGTRAGAMATRQAIDAVQQGISLEEKAKKSKELREALEKWGHMKTK